MRILLVKTSSLGDVIHNLPVAADLVRQFPGAEIDWCVEEGFADIPRLSPVVCNVIPVAVRRWRKVAVPSRDLAGDVCRPPAARQADYDAVLDCRGCSKCADCAPGE